MSFFVVGSTNADACITLWVVHANGSVTFVQELDHPTVRNATWIERLQAGSYVCTNEAAGTISLFTLTWNGLAHEFGASTSSSSYGASPTHIAVCHDHKELFASNFHGGSLSIFSFDSANPSALRRERTIKHGQGDDTTVAAHVHQSVVNRAAGVLYVCDLGLDAVYTYSLDETHALLATLQLPAGTGPRHAVISLCGRWLYIVCELSNELVVASIDRSTGRTTDFGDRVYSTLPAGADGEDMGAAEVLLSADGWFLYVSNRDVRAPASEGTAQHSERSSLGVFRLDTAAGTAALVQCAAARGRHPRHMSFAQGGALLVVANRDSQSFAAFAVNPASGLLDEAGAVVSPCGPHCTDPGFLLQVDGDPVFGH